MHYTPTSPQHSERSQIRQPKFQRNGEKCMIVSRSSSSKSSNSQAFSKFYVKNLQASLDNQSVKKIKNIFIDKSPEITQRKKQRNTIKAMRLKIFHGKEESDKSSPLIKIDNPKINDPQIQTKEIQCEILRQENKFLKQKIISLEKQIKILKQDLILKADSKQLQNKSQEKLYRGKFQNDERYQKLLNYSFLDEKSFHDQTTSAQIFRQKNDSTHFQCNSTKYLPNLPRQDRNITEQLYQAKQEIARMHINHNFQLRRLDKELECYKTNKQKQICLIKQKLNEILKKYKDMSKKAASLEIRGLIQKKTRKNQYMNQRQYDDFYYLTSDDESTSNLQSEFQWGNY